MGSIGPKISFLHKVFIAPDNLKTTDNEVKQTKRVALFCSLCCIGHEITSAAFQKAARLVVAYLKFPIPPSDCCTIMTNKSSTLFLSKVANSNLYKAQGIIPSHLF